MSELVLHSQTRADLQTILVNPPQALVLVADSGAGKHSVLQLIAAGLLSTTVEDLSGNPQILTVEGEAHISIEAIRRIQHFLALKPADKTKNRRLICIENADRMTIEAQNALLNCIEEPPTDSFVLLTTTSVNQLLPTIMSRVQVLHVLKPAAAELKQYFKALGTADAAIERAYAMSGGLPGAMASLLEGNSDHPVLQAADAARTLLQASKFERLVAIDSLAKDREAAIRVCGVLAQMAEISLKRDGLTAPQRERWQTVLQTALSTSDKLRANAQAKLALTAMSLQM